jgi:DNA polymerase-4
MYGIHTIGDVANTDPLFLKQLLGVNGLALWTYASGKDQSRVMHRDFVSPVKSVGHGITCNADLEDNDEVFRVMLELSQDIGHRLRIHELSARGVQVWVRGNDLFGAQFQCKLPVRTQLPNEIAAAGFRVFKEKYHWNTKVRAVCVRAIDLVPKADTEQLSLFDNAVKRAKKESLEDAVESIRSRFGKRAITYVTLLGNLKMPDDGRDTVKMPGLMYQ